MGKIILYAIIELMIILVGVVLMKKVEVVAAVFKDQEGRYYCARRKDEGPLAVKWEFPGGKIEAGETHQEALKREIQEELNTDINVNDFIMTVNHQYEHFHLTMHAYHATILNGSLTQNEHTGAKWLNKDQLDDLDWAEADLPIVDVLKK